MSDERYPGRGFRDDGPEGAKATAWANVGRKLGSIWRKHPWTVADWWVDGDDLPRGVRKMIVQAPDWDGPPYETCKQWGRIARKYPPGCRYRHLDIWHHQEAAGLPDELRQSVLKQAEREHWIVNRLRVEVRRLRFRKPLVGGDVFTTLEALIRAGRKYRGILIDPPWPIIRTPGINGSPDPHYAELSLLDIERLPIQKVALNDAMVFMWSPASMMKHAIAILEGWGFEYKTHGVWDKLVDFGNGYYFRMIHEDLLLGVAPGAQRHFNDRAIESMIRVKRPGKHSEKPEEVHRIVERAIDGPWVELFARKHVNRPGWDCFGDQLAPREENHQLAAD
jgi:N6-adenosine-specific RNA methylase IME4